MIKLPFLATLLVLCFNVSFAQVSTDSLSVKRSFGNYKFYQGEKRLSFKELKNTMKYNEQASAQMKSAQSANTFGTILGTIGGFMVGWALGTAVGGGDPDGAVAAIGAGFMVASIPFNIKFIKQTKKSVAIFNSGQTAGSF